MVYVLRWWCEDDIDEFIYINRNYLCELYISSYPERYMWDDCFERAENDMINSKRVHETATDIMHGEYEKRINYKTWK
jgi:hypothetical protein